MVIKSEKKKRSRGWAPIIVTLLTICLIAFLATRYIYYGDFRHNLLNGHFDMKRLGWRGGDGKIINEQGSFAQNGYNWGFYQVISVNPGCSYTISADTKKGTSKAAARIVAVFYDQNHKSLKGYSINYWHNGNEWETIPEQTIKAPENTDKLHLYILTRNGEGYHYFDNVFLKKSKFNLSGPDEVFLNLPKKQTLFQNQENVSLENVTQANQPANSPPGINIYVVKKGDTLSGIAAAHQFELEELIKCNDIKNPGKISIGQQIIMPSKN